MTSLDFSIRCLTAMCTDSCISVSSRTQSKPRYEQTTEWGMHLTRLHWHYCRFFFVVHFLSIMALGVYLISSAYNFIWILHPRYFNLEFNGTCKFDDKCRMNALRRLLHGCQRISSSEYSEYSQYSHTTTVQAAPSGDRPKIRLDLYFDKKSMDFGLLMDLLAEASGIVQSLR